MSCDEIENNTFHKGNLLLLTHIDELQLSFQEKDVFQVFQLVVLKLSQKPVIYFKIPWPSKVFIPEHISKHMSILSEADRSTYWVVDLNTHFYSSTVGSEPMSCKECLLATILLETHRNCNLSAPLHMLWPHLGLLISCQTFT